MLCPKSHLVRDGLHRHQTGRYEIKFIRDVVSDVINTLNIVPLDVPRFAVGLKDRMDAVINLLEIGNSQKVVTVGIWGASGAGKSTLARAVYNDIFRNFGVSTFVSDVSVYSQNIHGLCKLQKQLLRDLLKRKSKEGKINNVYHGKAILKDHLQSICALVILDNVDSRKQLEMLGVGSLGKGSRIIVTTRDKSVLNVGADQAESENDDRIYALQELGKEEALQLFISHAFLKARPDKEYKNLSEKIVDACGGLPFSLEVVGSFLHRRKDKRCWNEVLSQLRRATFDGIYETLKIIYQDLSAEEKQIFLDIACFMVGQDQEAAISFWEDLNLHPHNNLSNLILKSLVKIDYQQKPIISMHDHLRDLGRAIVAEESRDPSKRSRLWKPEEAYQALLERPEFETVQSISLSGIYSAVLKAEYMESTKNLQLFWLGNTTIEGDLQPLSSNLRWFRWNSCPLSSLPPEWNMEHLVILDLSSSRGISSQIKQIWKEESEYKHYPKNLKILLLRRFTLLETLPDLSNFSLLLRIDLEACSELRKIPKSIGLLLQLKWLNLCRCRDLGGLPESIGNLSSLEKLYLNGCSSIRTLPRTLGDLRALTELDLGGLVLIEELPPFQTGCCLQKLVLSGCQNLRNLPASIGDLNHLSYLEMNGCRAISYLPEEFGQLTSLQELFLNEFYRLEKLPESFGNLRNLVTLELRKARCLIKLPEDFSKLDSLVHFDASFSHLDCLPARMGDLSSLEILKLQGTFFEGLPDSVNQLKKLKTLILNECNMLNELPALPEALVKFQARDCKELRRVDQLSGLSNLTVMDVRNCQCLEELPVISSMESLTKIDIRGCISIRNLENLRLGRLKSLQALYLDRSDSSGLNLGQVVEDIPLFRRSNALAAGNHPLESNCFKDVVSFPVEKNPRCEGVLLFFELEFNAKGIKNARMEIVFVVDEEETINGLTVDTEGEEQFILIFRATHEVVVALEKARSLCVRAKGEGIGIRLVEIRLGTKFQEAISEEDRGAVHGLSEGERDMNQEMHSYSDDINQYVMVDRSLN